MPAPKRKYFRKNSTLASFNSCNVDLKRNIHTFFGLFNSYSLPLAWLDLNALDENIRSISERLGGVPVRIASKSIRNRYVLDYIAANQTNVAGIMAFSPAEAQMLIEKGCRDVLLAYPSMEKELIVTALRTAKERDALLTFMVDTAPHIHLLNEIAAEENTSISVCIDVDMSVRTPFVYFGVFRSSIRSLSDLNKLLDLLLASPSLHIWGVMGYEAQLAGVADNVKGKGIVNFVIGFLKKKSVPVVARRRKEAVELVQQRVGRKIQVNGGGTGSVETTKKEAYITEITVGSGYFQSHLFDNYRNFSHVPAVGFVLRITRNPEKNTYTCQSGGFIASGATDVLKQPQVYLPEGAALLKNEGAGEVQTPLKYKGNELEIGKLAVFRHAKAGEVCEHFDELHAFRNNRIEYVWKTYRGEGYNFY